MLLHLDRNRNSRPRSGVSPGTCLRLTSTQVRPRSGVSPGTCLRLTSTQVCPRSGVSPGTCLRLTSAQVQVQGLGGLPCRAGAGAGSGGTTLQGSVPVALAASTLANILQSLPEWCTLGGGQAGADLARLVGLGFGV